MIKKLKEQIKNEILDILFKKSSKCSFCGSLNCNHSNRTLTAKINREIVIEALNNVLGE